MRIQLLNDRKEYGYAGFGSIWKKGEVKKCEFRLLKGNGEEIPVQSRITAFWPDGSIKWAEHILDSGRLGRNGEVLAREEKRAGALPQEGSACGGAVVCREEETGFRFCSPSMSLWIPKQGDCLLQDIMIGGKLRALEASLKLLIERRCGAKTAQIRTQYTGRGVIKQCRMEDCGPLMWGFCLKGIHRLDETGEELFPFIVRLRLYGDTDRIDIQHTFIYDGEEERDFLKGIGIAFSCPLKGEVFNRHIRYGTDFGSFHEASALMLVWDHKHPGEIYDAQIKGMPIGEGMPMEERMPMGEGMSMGEMLTGGMALTGQERERLAEIAENCPAWDTYQLYQDSDMHFCIRKKTKEEGCCFLNALHGKRAKGTMAFGSLLGSMMAGIRDFWQKYPSGLEVNGLNSDRAEAVLWFYTPQAEAYDYRHYDKRAYAQTYYEGFDDFGATPYGVASTHDCSVEFVNEMIPSEERLMRFGESVSKPPVYFGDPQYYHELHAFGYWSLPEERKETEIWLEMQLDKAVDFYRREVEARHWYGIYDYGDVMHTYDCFRHSWRYDIGGYAWQNTELMPVMWLWLAFLRSGRSDILTLAEAMSRHAGDVDTYHLGDLKGLGTRHGVRHWGCPCKEIRIGMAGHYRYHYYLLCDRRMEDVFEDVKDADFKLLAMDPLRYVYDRKKGTFPTHARSGPDWSAMVSNWMTQWERTLDETYLKKIIVGMEDIKAAPLGLISGPDFEYDPATGHLGYIGESATGGTHLQIALGAPQIWMELKDLLEDEEWGRLLARYGRFYYMTPQERERESGGLIGNRQFLYPIMAAAMAAYGARELKDGQLAQKTVKYVFRALILKEDDGGFTPQLKTDCGNLCELSEIPWISTNFTSQWCLNVIMILEFIREYLPDTMEEVKGMLADFPEEGLFRNC